VEQRPTSRDLRLQARPTDGLARARDRTHLDLRRLGGLRRLRGRDTVRRSAAAPGTGTFAGNKHAAISFAAYRAAVDLFPGDKASVFDPLMASLGYDPSDLTTDPSTPAGIGNLASAALLDYRHRDRANQLGDEPGGLPGVPYSDYTAYEPVNSPMDIRFPFDPASVHDPDRWQPLRYVDDGGALVTPAFVGAQWQRVTPFAMASNAELRSPTGPATFGTNAYRDQCQQLIDISAALTDREKMIAEYWADGPRSELPPGHWNLFAQQVAHRDRSGDSEHDLAKQ
jgi:hypothetical protein